MRRAAAAPMLRIAPGPVPACARLAFGQGGAQFVAAPLPDGVEWGDAPVAHVVAGAPNPAEQVAVVDHGQLAVSVAGGVARSYRLPRPTQVHDRRPPGLLRVVGADGANACVLCREADWSAVVLPSLGDIATGVSSGQVAMRPDGRRVAAIVPTGVAVHDLNAGGEIAESHAGAFSGVCFAHDGSLVVGAGSAVGRVGVAAGDGSPVIQLAAASGAPIVAARHADGRLSVWSTEDWSRLAEFQSPVLGPANLAISADGTAVALGTPWADPAVAAVHRTSDGMLVRLLHDVRSISFGPQPAQLLVGGAWGIAWLDQPPEAT